MLLAYRLPREPSTPRITIWRKLRQLGAAQIVDGLVALPLDARTKEQLEWIAGEVGESGGDAIIWLGRIGSARAERELTARMAADVAIEYQAVTDAAEAASAEVYASRRRVCTRLRRRLHRIAQRDYFPPPGRSRAHRAVEALAHSELVTA